jgi:cytidyltransferase-like protein
MDFQSHDQERIATIGGTFHYLHFGHKDYIRLAFEYANHVRIYVNSDEYCKDKKKFKVRPYNERVKDLEAFLREINCQTRYQIVCLEKRDDLVNDYLNNLVLREKIYMAIVSHEYYEFFHALNEDRKKMGLESFLILVKERAWHYSPKKNIKDYSSTKTEEHITSKHIRAERYLFLSSDSESDHII